MKSRADLIALYESYRKHLGSMHGEGAAYLTLAHVVLELKDTVKAQPEAPLAPVDRVGAPDHEFISQDGELWDMEGKHAPIAMVQNIATSNQFSNVVLFLKAYDGKKIYVRPNGLAIFRAVDVDRRPTANDGRNMPFNDGSVST